MMLRARSRWKIISARITFVEREERLDRRQTREPEKQTPPTHFTSEIRMLKRLA
jgi:hypothetical protein